jgi:hypothetical protein
MSRFADWRARRQNVSRHTERAAPSRRGSNGAARATLAPDTASHLSDGVVVETRLVARLLGLRVLRVDGVVHLAPARLEWGDAGPRPARASELALGEDLARASRLLEDGDRRLECDGRHDTGLASSPRAPAS